MNGTNHDEGRLFEPFFFDPTFTFVPGGPAEAAIGPQQFPTYLAEVAFFSKAAVNAPPTDAPILAALYPREDFPNPDNGGKPSADEALSQIFTDVVFTCNAFSADQLLAKFVPVYAYEFNDPNAPNLFQPLIGFSYGSSHASELQYLFDAATLQGPTDAAANAASPAPGAGVQPPPLTAGGQTLADEMKAYWANFVTGGTPNAATSEVAFWSPFDPTSGNMQSLVPGPAAPHAIFDFASEHNCAALASLGL
jgi:para-nitrobenzyl esterase